MKRALILGMLFILASILLSPHGVQAGPPVPDPDLDKQWAIDFLDLPGAWAKVEGNANIDVIDIGLEVDHEDLRAFPVVGPKPGNFRLHLSYDFRGIDDPCPDEIESSIDSGSNSPCDGSTPVNPVGPAGNAAAGHGTHVSGIIAATPDNGLGVTGTCKHCSLLMSRMRTNSSDIPPALYWGIDRGSQILSGSFAAPESDGPVDCPPVPGQHPAWTPLCEALALADERDVVMVFAAGNNLGRIDFPARYGGAIAVGGVEQDRQVWREDNDPGENCPFGSGNPQQCGSNFGPELDLIAPAEDIFSTVYKDRQWSTFEECGDGSVLDGYGYCTGTSMSTPFVAGLAGLVRSANPLLTKQNVYDILTRTADRWPTRTDTEGYGVPNARLAVERALGLTPARPLANRLTPLFSLYSEATEDHLYTTVPQVASSAIAGLLHGSCTSTNRGDCPTTWSYHPVGPAVPGYSSFPGVPPCNVSPCVDASASSVSIFTSEASPYPGARPLVPLYRMTYKGPNPNGVLEHRDTNYTTEVNGLNAFRSVGYELDGIEGYIFAKCTPEPGCIPAGTVRLFRRYNPQRDDFAIFPESELAAMEAQGYTSNGGASDVLGYVYPNIDSDGDTLIDGFESLIGTNPALQDTDGDGWADGFEALHYPYHDPLNQADGPVIIANPDVLNGTPNTRLPFLASSLMANDSPGVVFIRAEAVPGVTLGTLELIGASTDVAYDYVPPPGYVGQDTFDYLISADGNLPYVRGHVTVNIVAVDELPVARFTWTCAGRTCSFDASTSTDDHGITAYAWDFGDGTTGSGVTISHPYTTSGNKTVKLTVTDTASQTDDESKTFLIDLDPNPCFTWVRDGLTITFNATCSTDDLGITIYAWNFGDGTTGAGATVSHTYATSGKITAQLTVTDTGSHSKSTSQTVAPDAKPVACFTYSCTLRTCTFNASCSTDNQPLASYSWSFGDGATGSNSPVTHVYATGGVKTVILTVTDSVGQMSSQTQTIVLNRPPVAVNDTASATQNVALDISVLANDSDPDGDPITVSTWTQPAHGTVTKNANNTMHYVPATGYLGGDSFTYQISDGKEPSNAATVSLTVNVPNNPPDARDDGWSTYQNGPTNIPYVNLLANDYDPDGDTLTVSGVNTAGLTGTLDCSFGTYCRYSPPSWFVGTTSFTYTASDGKGGTDPATVRIKVGVANNAPVPQDDILETMRNTALVFTQAALLLNDTDADGDVLSVTAVNRASLTGFGTVSCAASFYKCTYTPPAGFTGVDVLTYRVSDGITFTDARLRILVRPPSPAVLDAHDDVMFTTTTTTYLSYTWMTSNDYTPAGGALTVVSVDTTGLLGTLDCTTFSTGCDYTRGTNDPTRFRYTVRDAQGNQETVTVTLKPGNQTFNKLPVVANDQLSTRTNTPLTFSVFDVLRNDYDPDNDQLNIIFNYGSSFGHVLCTTPAYSCTYTPNAGFMGTDTLTYTVNDGNNAVSGTVAMTVQPVVAKDAQILSQSVPVSMFAGQTYPVSLRIKNVGTQAWGTVGPQCNAFRLGSVNPYDNTIWGPGRTELPASLAPGGEVTLTFNITAPATPGTYNFQRRMVHECVEWFGDLSPNVVVSVVNP